MSIHDANLNGMNNDAYRELKALEQLAVNPTITQRGLASELRIALGLANLMIRRLVKKGYLEAVNTRKNRLRYLVTPKGLAEKTRLSYEFLEYSLHLYREVRRVLTETLSRVLVSGGRRVVFFGANEIAEVGFLTLKELGLELVGVVDQRAAGKIFLGRSVISLDQLDPAGCDCVIVSALGEGLDVVRKRLERAGVPAEKVILVHRDRHVVQAEVPPTLAETVR